MTTILLLILIGLIGGFFSGVMGIGGGLVMIPLLVFALGFSQHEAQGTSLAILAVPVTFIAAYTYYDAGHVNLKYAAIIALTFLVGGYLGSKLAISIDQLLLKRIFGVILVIAAVKLFFGK